VGAAPLACGASIAIEAAMVAVLETSREEIHHG
jgi:hypothetical protein